MNGNPTVTLLGNPGDTFLLLIGSKKYIFAAGQPKSVGAEVARVASKKFTVDGTPIFKINNPIKEDNNIKVEKIAIACISGLTLEGYQKKFKEWH